MKDKLIKSIITMLVGACTATGASKTVEWYEDYCNSDVEIVDWNTDGNELAMYLSNGTELYAYHIQDEYSEEWKNYVALDNIARTETKQDGTIIIETKSGYVYEVK